MKKTLLPILLFVVVLAGIGSAYVIYNKQDKSENKKIEKNETNLSENQTNEPTKTFTKNIDIHQVIRFFTSYFYSFSNNKRW